MEDISYFLVGRIEGGKNGAKTVSKTESQKLVNCELSLNRQVAGSSNISMWSTFGNRGISNISREIFG